MTGNAQGFEHIGITTFAFDRIFVACYGAIKIQIQKLFCFKHRYAMRGGLLTIELRKL